LQRVTLLETLQIELPIIQAPMAGRVVASDAAHHTVMTRHLRQAGPVSRE
jgi:NAD(P)H-dependent flavin oxidoreductase YrpB (nitropropane dioxygenase family)